MTRSTIEPVRTTWAEHATATLSAAGHREGGARRAVVELLAEQECCLTAQEIFDTLRARGRRVGIASVYRILEQLAQLRLVQRVEVGGGLARYEPQGPGGEHHHHVVCGDCGRVDAFSDEALERAVRRAGERLGYDAAHEIVLHGACADCRT